MRRESGSGFDARRLAVLCGVVLVAGVLAACGGGDATTSAEPATTAAAEEAATTAETAAAAADTAAFDAAAAQVVAATDALIALRTECFDDDNPVGCFASKDSDGEFAAAEEALTSALAAAGTEATAAGASPDACQGLLDTIGPKLPAEREALFGRYGLVDGELVEMGLNTAGHASYFTTLGQQFASDPGYMVALALGDCRLAVAPDAPNAQLLNATLAYVYGVILARNSIGYGSWGLSFCLGNTSGAEERASCLQQMGDATALTEGLGKMSAGFADMTAAPGYAELSSTCKSGFEGMNDLLSTTGADLESLYGDAAAVDSDEANMAAYERTFPLLGATDQREDQPLDEATVLACLDEVAAQGG